MYVLFTRASRFTRGTAAGAPGGTSECETFGWDGFTVGCILFTGNSLQVWTTVHVYRRERDERQATDDKYTREVANLTNLDVN